MWDEEVCMVDEKTISVSLETSVSGSSMIRLYFTNSGTYLGRAWSGRPQMVYAYTSMTKVVNPASWSDDNHRERNNNVACEEYKCMGPGSSTYNERNLSKGLTDKQVKPFFNLGYIQASSSSSGCYSRTAAANLPIYVHVGITASVCLLIFCRISGC